MSHRTALLVGVDHTPHAAPLQSARADVIDLARTLLRRGVPADHIRVLTSPPLSSDALPELAPAHRGLADQASVRAGLQWVARQLGDDDTALVHMSGRGTTTLTDGHAVALADGTLPVSDIQAAFVDHPVRSVLTVLDVGFAGDPATGRTLGAQVPMAELAHGSGDPVITANGGHGPVVDVERGGELRGALSWALGRVLQMPTGAEDWRFADLMAALRTVHALGGVAQSPVLLPTGVAERGLGALIDGQPAHVPWRGVSAHFQMGPCFAPINPIGGGPAIGTLDITTPGGHEQWSWGSAATSWPDAGFNAAVQPGGAGPGPGVVYTFSNNGFQGPPSSAVPQVAASDRVYWVQVPQAAGHQVVLIARFDIAGNPTAMDWYTTSSQPYLPVAPGDVLAFSQHVINPAVWQQSSWYHAHEV